jgi:uncharacterized protein
MKIIVDADACPGKHIIEEVAKEFKLDLIFYCDINHILTSDYATVKYMDSGFQSVDMKIANEAKLGDIVVTQDYGVAAMVLGKKAYAISPKGNIYSDDNIEKLLFERHLSAKVRRGGGKTASHKKRSSEDDVKLKENLIRLIRKRKSKL